MKTTLLRPGLYVTLKYSNFATKYFKNMIVLIYYFFCKSSFYGADVMFNVLFISVRHHLGPVVHAVVISPV